MSALVYTGSSYRQWATRRAAFRWAAPSLCPQIRQLDLSAKRTGR